MSRFIFEQPISRLVWESKYRLEGESAFADTAARVALAVAAAEPGGASRWPREFHQLLNNAEFLPGGRILAGAGSPHNRTLFNCFVMGYIEDSMAGIFEALRDGATTLQLGGGVGYDFSSLRPAGFAARSSGNVASGPVSFMTLWDTMSATVVSTGGRRGAMMATLRCDHPDVSRFITAKRQENVLSHFNLSVQVTSDFMAAVRSGQNWPLVFPDPDAGEPGVVRDWPGRPEVVPCRVCAEVPARDLWRQLVDCAWQTGDPGVLFVDRINHYNNLWYREQLSATNPCGEVPLPPWGACNLGSLNLPRFVRQAFSPEANVDESALLTATRRAVRFLDNVIDVSGYPLPQQAEQARGTRRIGIGVTGLADALCLLNLRYDSEAARRQAADLMKQICHMAYQASVDLAAEKGAFPWFDRDAYLAGHFIDTLPEAVRDGIARHGIRNSHLLALAPAGSISLLANNVSSGIEPFFAANYQRRILTPDGEQSFALQPYALEQWRRFGGGRELLPPAFVTATEVTPEDHVRMQAALQDYIDSAISKTIRLPESATREEVDRLMCFADDCKLKGMTVFRDRPDSAHVLSESCSLS